MINNSWKFNIFTTFCLLSKVAVVSCTSLRRSLSASLGAPLSALSIALSSKPSITTSNVSFFSTFCAILSAL